MTPRMRPLAELTADDLRIDQSRERKFRGMLRKLLGASDEVVDILSTTDGLLVTLKNGESFLLMVTNHRV